MSTSEQSKIFIVGTGRSGTHWLARSLKQSGLSCSMEKHIMMVSSAIIFNNYDKPEVWDEIVKTYKEEPCKIDKSHPLLWVVEKLLKDLPDSKFIAIIRNRDDVVKSMMKHAGVISWCSDYKKHNIPFPNLFLGAENETEYEKLTLIERCQSRWQSHTDEIIRLSKIIPSDKFMFVYYENLEKESENIQQFINCGKINIIPSIK